VPGVTGSQRAVSDITNSSTQISHAFNNGERNEILRDYAYDANMF